MAFCKQQKIHLLAPFQWVYLGNLVTARDGGNQSTYYHKFSAQSIWRETNVSNWVKNKNSIYPPNSVGNWLEKSNQSE